MITLEKLRQLKVARECFYIYFSAPGCGVCEVLHPKLKRLMQDEFPKLQAYTVNTSIQPEVAAQLGLYTNPSLLIFMDGEEVLRKSRAISLDEISQKLDRYYQLLF